VSAFSGIVRSANADFNTTLLDRFDEVCSKITPYLKQVGFNPKTDITFIPVSAYTGQNMKERVDKKIAPWSDGPALLEFLDAMPVADRKVNAPFMMPISEKYAEMGAIVVGKIETGRVKAGDKLLLMPNKVC
jgi:peptide chain release factor subunit 3